MTPDPSGKEKSLRGTLKADVDQYNEAESNGEENAQLLQRLAGIEGSLEELIGTGWREDFSRLRDELSRGRARLKLGQTSTAPGDLAREARQFRLRPAPTQAQSTPPPRGTAPVIRPVPSLPPRPGDTSGRRPPQPIAHPPVPGGERQFGMGHLYDADSPFNPTRVRPSDVVFLRRGKKFRTVAAGAPAPKQKPPVLSPRDKV